MPFQKIETDNKSVWALWKMEEEEHDLASHVSPWEQVPVNITNPRKRLEWITGRVMVKEMMAKLGHPFTGITKDVFGKPFLKDSDLQLSLSHSFPYVAAYIHPESSVGIDLEQPTPKLLKIAPRVLGAEELRDAGQDLIKHCLYWCAKEVLVKIYGKKDLIFCENLKIRPFSRSQQGEIVGSIIVGNKETEIPLYYEVHPAFTLVLNKPNQK